jgi:hypothetical protein
MANTNARSVRFSVPHLHSILITSPQLPLRNRVPVHRAKGDENAATRHLRQPSSISMAGASRFAYSVVSGFKANQSRPALTEVTTTAVNRKVRLGVSIT